jgi:hypothetical protein
MEATRRDRASALSWAEPMVMNYLDSSLRVETLSFDEAADFNPQEYSIWLVTISSAPTG